MPMPIGWIAAARGKMMASYDVLGIPIEATSLDRSAAMVLDWAKDDRGRYVGVRDVASTVVMSADPELLAVARGASLNVPDGMPIVWLGRKRGYDVKRTCGPDLFEYMIAHGRAAGLRHFFYGGKDGVALKLKAEFETRYPGARIVGTYCPPFRDLTPQEDADVIDQIRASGADVVWVGMSSPKQDVWMARYVDRLPVTLIGVGAAFDFHAGTVRRAPVWMQRAGLEWFFRLCSEPRRLWRRYLILGPTFLFRTAVTSDAARKRSVPR